MGWRRAEVAVAVLSMAIDDDDAGEPAHLTERQPLRKPGHVLVELGVVVHATLPEELA